MLNIVFLDKEHCKAKKVKEKAASAHTEKMKKERLFHCSHCLV